jgi:tetratricopeptide (TPR) repeat protein
MSLRSLLGLNNKEGNAAMQPVTPENKPEEHEQAKPAEEPQKITAEVKTLEQVSETTGTKSSSLRPEIRPHAFVIMPFGKKKGSDGSPFDFNAIYAQLIKPTLEMAGFEAFRADEETSSGDILTDMFQELLLADLCIVDMSIDNANVFYELGIRHAFRKRGIVHIQAGRAYMPFDVFNVRTIPYHITPEGVPDPDFIEKDKAAISRVTQDTWKSDSDAIHSPVFNILTGLTEPDRNSLRTPLATGFWREYDEWKERVTIARRQKRIGDILLLTEEIRNPLIKEEAIGEAGKALKNMDRYELALDQFRKGLEVNPRNMNFRREEAFNLNRLGRVDDAIVKIENLIADAPDDGESISYLGRIYKEMWVESWKWVKNKDERLKTAFDSYHWLLKSIDTYLKGYRVAFLKGYRVDLDQYYPGVNALTLSTILVELAQKFENPESPDPEITWVKNNLEELRGSLVFALETYIDSDKVDYWSLVSMAELTVLIAKNTQEVVRSYRKALTASRRNTFFLNSSLAQLEILKALEIRSEFVEAGIDVIQEELRRMHKEEELNQPDTKNKKEDHHHEGYVFLFTGYMISHARKKGNHFPPEKENDIRTAIRAALEKYHAGADDLAVTTGMDAGSEIVFVESCVERGVPVHAYFPFAEAPYIRDFVSPGGDDWVERFYKMRNHPLVDEFYQPDQVGLPKEGDNVHERNNRWALYSALIRGIDKVRLIALWDGKNDISEDLDVHLVKHMVDLMRDTGGVVEQINPLKLPATAIDSMVAATENGPSPKVTRKRPSRKKSHSKKQE